jgi:hypothetical protein
VKLLVATNETQGRRSNDFCWTNEGELVMHGTECDREAVDDSCGCRRSLVGLESAKATTTFKVAEIDTTLDGFAEQLQTSLRRRGWITDQNASAWVESVRFEAADLERIARPWPVGTVLERRGTLDSEAYMSREA